MIIQIYMKFLYNTTFPITLHEVELILNLIFSGKNFRISLILTTTFWRIVKTIGKTTLITVVVY